MKERNLDPGVFIKVQLLSVADRTCVKHSCYCLAKEKGGNLMLIPQVVLSCILLNKLCFGF